MILRTVDFTRAVWLTLVFMLACAGASALGQWGSARDIVLGAGFMIGDFLLIRTLVSRLIRPRANRGLTLLLLQAKFLMVLLLFAAVMMQWHVEPMSFALGASLLLVALLIEATLSGDPVPPLEAGAYGRGGGEKQE